MYGSCLIIHRFFISYSSSSIVHAFDHIYPESEDNLNVVVLYGSVGSSEFLAAHNKMVDLAKQGKAKYVFRHHVTVCSK